MFNFNNKTLKKAIKIKDKAKQYNYRNLSDDELRNKTSIFRMRLESGEDLDEMAPEAFATVAEAIYREEGIVLHDNQYEAAWVLHSGDIAEQPCGQGKTITGITAAYLEALPAKGVHIVTVNEYLANRDADECRKIYERLGMSVGVSLAKQSSADKRLAYNCDVTYTTNSEVGFDYLRDNMVVDMASKVQRGLNVAFIDEADSVLIDDARTPLIISGQQDNQIAIYAIADKFAKKLKKEDYEINIEFRTIQLTDSGMDKVEKVFGLNNLYAIENKKYIHAINNALKANYIMKPDVDYMVHDGEVKIIDPSTGRLMEGREWSDGLHQAVQAKEGVKIKGESKTVATITYQNLFRLYNKLAGMTGTAKTEEEEFHNTYNMRVIVVPPNEKIIREDLEDQIYATKRAKYKAIVNKVKQIHATGQPVLLGTISVDVSEKLDKMLTAAHLPHEVLNAKNHAKEAEIIAKAGQKGAITVATNMAGRGTDIKLGEGVAELGGLFVIGSERHEARRIDNQLRGRAGRQGDPGKSQFFISLEDDLMQRFGTDAIKAMIMDFEDEALESRTVSNGVKNAQVRIEGMNFDYRKNLREYDDVIRQQREIYYHDRDTIMQQGNVHKLVVEMISEGIDDWFKEPVEERSKMLKKFNYETAYINDKENFKKEYIERYEKGLDEVIDKASFEKNSLLRIMDNGWQEHIDAMVGLKNSVNLRGYFDANPLNTYINESLVMFENYKRNVKRNVFIKYLNPVKPRGISLGTLRIDNVMPNPNWDAMN